MVDQDKIREAVKLLLEGIGEDIHREGLADTPERIARMYEEIFGGMEENAAEHLSKVFTVDSHE
ncbi:MAG: GTP cyclohydrolase I, partial [Acetatifactor sp.]|nr:GTP cyclohydrolase I [Acetatifactor sp.]